MEGPPKNDNPETRGMISRAVDEIFNCSKKLKELGWTYSMHASFLEIYNDTLRDLLVANPTAASNLEMRENNKTKAIELPGLISGTFDFSFIQNLFFCC